MNADFLPPRTENDPLRVGLSLSPAQARFLLRLIRSGFFGGPSPTIAEVAEEIFRQKLRELETEASRAKVVPAWASEDHE